ncbi:MAG: GDP-mannose 4,6-dehydratase [Desulfovibrio sp.]|jgi:GDPmannose 4,6-dehydratase|nr:GDP-mannose 4,6-dehydratase [Desulfovibrio sp.]
MPKRALITGVFGQDGSYLCELLSGFGYSVAGVVRKKLSDNSRRIRQYLMTKGIEPSAHETDLSDYAAVAKLLDALRPDELYHMAAMHVSSQGSEDELFEKSAFESNLAATLNILAACRKASPATRVVLAGSCLIYDDSDTLTQDENTPPRSNSLYGIAKIAEMSLARHYRSAGLHASTAILYNHESSRRPDGFVTRKIAANMVALKKGRIAGFTLGSLDAEKDWGYAGDYAMGMYLMAQQPEGGEFVLSSGTTRTIRDFLAICAEELALRGWEDRVRIDATLINRRIAGRLRGNPGKASAVLGWKPFLSFEDLARLMVVNELKGELR